MPYVAIVTVVVLLQFLYFGFGVGRARVTYCVAAPAITGNDIFERHFRVQQNTLEQLVIFLPALWIFSRYISPLWGAALGVVFIIGRAIYAAAYVRDPKSRNLGFGLTSLPTLGMLIAIVVWAVRALIVGSGAV
jgi:uncharacterized MAPEG superfamily protein